MFQKVFEYAGPHKKGLYAATAIVLVSVLLGVFPFVLAYQVIAPLVMGEAITASFIIQHVILVLVCLVLQALFYGWGLNLSHKAAYDTLLRLRTALQKRFEKLPLGVIQDKGTGTVKKLFVDDVDSLEVLLAHSMPEGIANLMVPIAVYVAMFFVDWKLALLSLASIPLSLVAMMTMYSVGMKKICLSGQRSSASYQLCHEERFYDCFSRTFWQRKVYYCQFAGSALGCKIWQHNNKRYGHSERAFGRADGADQHGIPASVLIPRYHLQQYQHRQTGRHRGRSLCSC